MRWVRTLARAALVAGVTFTMMFLMLVLVVRLVVVPRIGDFRDEITAMIGNSIGRKVTIAEINAGWDGWSPTLNLVDFRLFDTAGNQALTLPRIETSVAWRSLVAG
jgi:uncharacterized protein YhdP